jgi:hypothetical protein
VQRPAVSQQEVEMSDEEVQPVRQTMTLQSGALIYAGLLIVWLVMLKLAMSTAWFPNDVLIIYHLVAGFALNRWVLRDLLQWHPLHATLNNVVKVKLSAFFFWPLAYAGFLFRMLVDKVL